MPRIGGAPTSFQGYVQRLEGKTLGNRDELRAMDDGTIYVHFNGLGRLGKKGNQLNRQDERRYRDSEGNLKRKAEDNVEPRRARPRALNVHKEIRALKRQRFRDDLFEALKSSYGKAIADSFMSMSGIKQPAGSAITGEQFNKLRDYAAALEAIMQREFAEDNIVFRQAVAELKRLDPVKDTLLLRTAMVDIIDRHMALPPPFPSTVPENEQQDINIAAGKIRPIQNERPNIDQMSAEELNQLRGDLDSAVAGTRRMFNTARYRKEIRAGFKEGGDFVGLNSEDFFKDRRNNDVYLDLNGEVIRGRVLVRRASDQSLPSIDDD